jgi:hypothetical protein
MSWNRNSDILELKLRDESNRVIYKSKICSSDIKKLSLALKSLETLGVKILEAFSHIIKEDKKDSGWFD